MKINYLLLLGFVLILFPFVSILNAEINILFPSDNQTLAVSDVHVIGISDSDKNVTVSINEHKYVKKLLPSFSENGEKIYMLMSILKLDNGENAVTVKQDNVTRKIVIDKVESPVVLEDWTEELSTFHSEDEKKVICKKCHKFQNIKDCINCHKGKLIGKWVHKPVKKASCFKCHQKENEFKPIQPFSDTCLDCHNEFRQSLQNAEYGHGPVSAGYCTICHSPHKSADKTHLRNDINFLCNQCHISGTMGYKYHQNSYIKEHPVKGEVIDKTGEKLNCTSCHNPHYADDKMFLAIKGVEESELCTECHDDEDTKELLRKLSE